MISVAASTSQLEISNTLSSKNDVTIAQYIIISSLFVILMEYFYCSTCNRDGRKQNMSVILSKFSKEIVKIHISRGIGIPIVSLLIILTMTNTFCTK